MALSKNNQIVQYLERMGEAYGVRVRVHDTYPGDMPIIEVRHPEGLIYQEYFQRMEMNEFDLDGIFRRLNEQVRGMIERVQREARRHHSIFANPVWGPSNFFIGGGDPCIPVTTSNGTNMTLEPSAVQPRAVNDGWHRSDPEQIRRWHELLQQAGVLPSQPEVAPEPPDPTPKPRRRIAYRE